MLKVFLVEDESLICQGLRDGVPWEDCGFEFSGEASDGEMALPLIRRVRPDLLITDIKMPFMDGLELCRLVSKELPDTKIIILSGYDDFQYARQAIELHVSQYLLKPVTKNTMIEALRSLRTEIERDRDQRDFLQRFNREMQEYEKYSQRRLFELMTSGTASVAEIYEKAAELGIELDAAGYNLVLFMIQPQVVAGEYSDSAARLLDELVDYFIHRPEYLLFRPNLMSYVVLIKGEEHLLEERTKLCVEYIRSRCEEESAPPQWYVAIGQGVSRISGLPRCFSQVSHILSYRHLMPNTHILTSELAESQSARGELNALSGLDASMTDPMILRNFVKTGLDDEIEDFVDEILHNLGTAVDSMMFRQYLMLSARFSAEITLKSLGCDPEEFVSGLEPFSPGEPPELRDYMVNVLRRAISLRDRESQSQCRTMIRRALRYIDANFADESISLNAVAREVNVSANYLSAIFSREMGMTFVEYLTQQRMEKARQLLRDTDKRSGEIGFEVGYSDPRYFSFIFKKTQGCTPRDYRAGKEGS